MPKLREKVINEPILDLTALKAIDDSVDSDGVLVNVTSLGIYRLDKGSVKTPDDNHVVLTNSGTGRWLKVPATYTGAATLTVGGIAAGTSYADEFTDIVIDDLIAPYINPSFTSFAISGVSNQEVGQKITGLKDFTWAISNPANAAANSIIITDTTNVLTLVTGHSTTSPASYDFTLYAGGGLEYDVPASNTWEIQATNTDVPPANFTRPLTINWYWLLHYGTSTNTSLNSAQILALSGSLLTPTTARTYAFGAGGYKYICAQDSLPTLTSFKDQSTNNDIPFEPYVTVSVTSAYGIVSNYKVYRSTNILGAAINIIAA